MNKIVHQAMCIGERAGAKRGVAELGGVQIENLINLIRWRAEVRVAWTA